jgi:ubiquinone/menaquinone biosynthesis C-methylase UbiE
MPFTDDFVAPADSGNEFTADIDIYVCKNCNVAQTQHNVDVDAYYDEYQYSVGGSNTAKVFMQLMAANLLDKYFPGRSGLKVLEVGSGDGEQLLAFKELGCDVLGYEPSSSLCDVAAQKGIPSVHGLFTNESMAQLPEAFRQVDIVILSYTFDHLPDPKGFLETTAKILHPERGLVVAEVHNLELILDRKEYCLFEHEHSVYLTEQTAKDVLDLAGYSAIDFNLVPHEKRRANSLIFVGALKGSQRGGETAAPGTPAQFSRPEFYAQQELAILQGIANIERYLENRAAAGKTVAGYGAGGRGVMTLAAVKNTHLMQYLVDKKPKAPGLLAPKSGVLVTGIDHLAKAPVDEILVFSFGYMPEIVAEVSALGYKPQQFLSMLNVLNGKY